MPISGVIYVPLPKYADQPSLISEAHADVLLAADRGYGVILDNNLRRLLPANVVQRAGTYSSPRVVAAGRRVLANLKRDQPFFGDHGLTPAVIVAFADNVTLLEGQAEALRDAALLGEVDRAIDVPMLKRADECISDFLTLSVSIGLRDQFRIFAEDRGTLGGVCAGLSEIIVKSHHPKLRPLFLAAGLTPAREKELAELLAGCKKEAQDRIEEEAQRREARLPLQLAKAVVLSMVLRVATVAKVALPPLRQESYQIATLLDLSARRAEDEPPAADDPPAGPTPAAPPGPGVPTPPIVAGPGVPTPPIVAGPGSSGAPGAVAGGAGGVPGAVAGGAGGVPGAGGAAGAVAGAGAVPAGGVAPPAAPPLGAAGIPIALKPGDTVAFKGADGKQRTARLQPDGTLLLIDAPIGPPQDKPKPRARTARSGRRAPRLQ